MAPLLTTRPKRSGDDNMIPLINIVFLLLIFFMVAGQIHTLDIAELALPESAAGEAIEEQALAVVMDREGRILVDGSELSLQDLETLLLKAGGETISPVSLQLDKHLTAGEIAEFLAMLRRLQLPALRLYTEQGLDSQG